MSNRVKLSVDYVNPPFNFEIELGNNDYFIGINYNEVSENFTIDLYDNNFSPIKLGEPLVYGMLLWRNCIDERVPLIDIIPIDESGQNNEITFANFGKSVFLYIDNMEEIEE